jgi:hypothetical protein
MNINFCANFEEGKTTGLGQVVANVVIFLLLK